MSVTGHKSMQSLAIYQKVREDDKLSTGISLTYSLIHPSEVKHLLDIIQEERKSLQTGDHVPALPPPPALPTPTTAAVKSVPVQQVTAPLAEIQPHALDPNNKNILPLESALVPYQPECQSAASSKMDTTPDFDLLEILNEFKESDTDVENQMVVAATQVENTYVMKKQWTANCSTSNIPELFFQQHWHNKYSYT